MPGALTSKRTSLIALALVLLLGVVANGRAIATALKPHWFVALFLLVVITGPWILVSREPDVKVPNSCS